MSKTTETTTLVNSKQEIRNLRLKGELVLGPYGDGRLIVKGVYRVENDKFVFENHNKTYILKGFDRNSHMSQIDKIQADIARRIKSVRL